MGYRSGGWICNSGERRGARVKAGGVMQCRAGCMKDKDDEGEKQGRQGRKEVLYMVMSGPLAHSKPRWSSSSWGSVDGSQMTVTLFWFEVTNGPMFSNLRPETVLSWSRTSMTA
jgi:hypothetical protein